MRRHLLNVVAAVAAPLAALLAPLAPAHADPGCSSLRVWRSARTPTCARWDSSTCSSGWPTPRATAAEAARSDDRGGAFIGVQSAFEDNTPDGTTVDVNHQISDWQTISLAPEVQVNNLLPSGRPLVVDPSVVPTKGMPVCHFGVVTGESCGTIEAVNNGWFTMANGVVSKKGDSGGPVYFNAPDGRAVIIGMFNSTWGQFPAAVSWQAATQRAGQGVVITAGAA